MGNKDTQFPVTLLPDTPLVQDAGYSFDAADRQYIDKQILAMQKAAVDLLVSGRIATYVTIDASSPAGAAGDVLCLANVSTTTPTFVRATTATLANAKTGSGVAYTAYAPGARVIMVHDGALSTSVTGLAAGASGLVRINVSTGRLERVASFSGADYPMGAVDGTGMLALNISPPLSISGGSGLPGVINKLGAPLVESPAGTPAFVAAAGAGTLWIGNSDGSRTDRQATTDDLAPAFSLTTALANGAAQTVEAGGTWNPTFNATFTPNQTGVTSFHIKDTAAGDTTLSNSATNPINPPAAPYTLAMGGTLGVHFEATRSGVAKSSSTITATGYGRAYYGHGTAGATGLSSAGTSTSRGTSAVSVPTVTPAPGAIRRSTSGSSTSSASGSSPYTCARNCPTSSPVVRSSTLSTT